MKIDLQSTDKGAYLANLCPNIFRKYKLRFILAAYHYACPNSTNNDFANTLGISPMTLSRALANDIFVKPEWESKLQTLFVDLQLVDFFEQAKSIARDGAQLHNARKRYHLSHAIMSYIQEKHRWISSSDFDSFDNALSICMHHQDTHEQWLFCDYDSVSLACNDAKAEIVSLHFANLVALCKANNIPRLTMFTTSEPSLKQIVGDFVVQKLNGELSQNGYEETFCFCSVILLNNDFSVAREVIFQNKM